MENLQWVLKYEQEFMAGQVRNKLEQHLCPLIHLISKQLYEMEMCPFYRWANQKGRGENQKQRPDLLPVFSGGVGVSENPSIPPAKDQVD